MCLLLYMKLKRRELVYLLSVGYMRNHNTVGGLGEEALFPVYWNGDSWPVLRVQKLLPITWNFHIITRRTRPRTEEIVIAQINGLQRRQIVN
ncbi:unnamed protein product [Brassica rapa]|uniref:Uncharacterized protein n=1 Tax=Brassica campestris TaxID=3711 RepID=A0A8D9GVR6_BRACM|nr:unnamed protein product [Brassica rapa]